MKKTFCTYLDDRRALPSYHLFRERKTWSTIVLLLITVRRRHEIFGPLTARNWTPDCIARGLGALIGYIKKCPTKTRLFSTWTNIFLHWSISAISIYVTQWVLKRFEPNPSRSVSYFVVFCLPLTYLSWSVDCQLDTTDTLFSIDIPDAAFRKWHPVWSI